MKSSSKRNGEDSKEKERYRRVREQQPLLLGLPRDQLVALSPQEEDKLRESPKLRERRADRDDKKQYPFARLVQGSSRHRWSLTES